MAPPRFWATFPAKVVCADVTIVDAVLALMAPPFTFATFFVNMQESNVSKIASGHAITPAP